MNLDAMRLNNMRVLEAITSDNSHQPTQFGGNCQMELRQFLDNRFRRPKIKLVTDGDADITIIRRDDELFYVTVDNKEDGKSIFPLDQPPVISTARTQHPFKESYIGGAEDVENAFKIFLNDRGISLLLATRDYSISLSHTKTAMAYSCAIGYGCNASVSWK